MPYIIGSNIMITVVKFMTKTKSVGLSEVSIRKTIEVFIFLFQTFGSDLSVFVLLDCTTLRKVN